jgi:F-type H+-transporting ATPase subunit b
MDQTLVQIGELLLGSVPTIIFMLALWGCYTLLVHRPLGRVLEERRQRTEGAVQRARADIAAAEARTREYEQQLREARAAIFRAQEARRQKAADARAAAVAEARNQAHAKVEQARAGIEADKQSAMTQLEAETGTLAAEIIRTVLEPAALGAES